MTIHEAIEAAKADNPINDYLDRQGLAGKKKGENSYFYPCPFHSEKTGSFHVNLARRWAHCFGCGWSGDVIDLVCEFDKCTKAEALKSLGLSWESSSLPPVMKPPRSASRGHQWVDVFLPVARRVFYTDFIEMLDGAFARDDHHPSTVEAWVRGKPVSHATWMWAAKEGLVGLCSAASLLFFYEHRVKTRVFGPDGSKAWWDKENDQGEVSPWLYPKNGNDWDKPLLLTEGEGDTLAAVEEAGDIYDVVGAQSASWRPDVFTASSLFLKRQVYIVGDNDAAGWNFADAVGQKAWKAGATSVERFLYERDDPKGFDLCDAVKAGRVSFCWRWAEVPHKVS